MRKVISKLPRRFRFTLHNIVGHPASEIFWQLGFNRVADWFHDGTLPSEGE